MNLKDFLASRDKPPELFWSVVIEPGLVQAGIWYIDQNSAEVLTTSPVAPWLTDEELISASDAALSSSIAKLPEDYAEPSKTVFGVPSLWVKGGEIQDEYLAKIKTVCTELSLTPVGFVVIPEAIAHLYKSEEGAPLSAIIIGLGSENIEVTVFKLGNLIGTTSVARSVSLIDDVTEGLSRFEGAGPLPSRIIVYDGKGSELEEAKEELMKADWEAPEKVKFLHAPKAEILTSERKVVATSFAGANEIGQVTKVNSQEEKAEESFEDLPPSEEIENIAEPETKTTPEDLGFSIGEDVANKTSVPEFVTTTVSSTAPVQLPQQKFKTLFHNFSSKIHFNGPKISSQSKIKSLYFGIGALLLFILVGGFYWWFGPKAKVTIFVSPKSFQEQVNIIFNTDGIFDESKAIVPAQIISSSQSGEKTISTTGSKLIGDKAAGSVQIANGNGDSIDLAAGTILTSSSGLKFVTNAEASISGQLIPGSPGTATISVKAADIGAQYNLAKGEVFRVGVYDKSQVAATSQADFSGGSSQQIAAVSADDQKNLETSLKNELSAKAIDDATNKVADSQILVNDPAGIDISNEKFDHNIGDTVDTLKLSLTASANIAAAEKTKLIKYATDALKDKIPSGYALRSSQINFKFTFVKKDKNNYTYNVTIGANFLPMVNTDDLIKQISGKTVAAVENYLNSVPGYTRAQVKLSPSLPGPLGTLPHVKNNISIDVATDQ